MPESSSRSSGSGAKKTTAKKTTSSTRTRTAPKDPLVESARQVVAAARTQANKLKADGQKAQERATQAAQDRNAVRIAATLKDRELAETEQTESDNAEELKAKAKRLTDILDPASSADEPKEDEPAPKSTRRSDRPAKSDDTKSDDAPDDQSDTTTQASWRDKLKGFRSNFA